MKMIKYIFASLLAVASMAAHAQVFDVRITPSDGSEVFTKTNAILIGIYPGNASPINVFSGGSDSQGTSLTVSHTVRYDFALTPATTINSGQDGGLPEGTFDANAPMRRTVEAPTFTEPELTGPALVLMREEGDPIIYYAKDGPIILKCNPDGEYIVGATKVLGTVTAVFYKDAHTPVTDAAVAPTCTATGKTEGSHCSVCEEVLVAQQEVAALGHDWKETETYLKSEATCSANAIYYKECDRCHAQGTDTWTKTGTATGNHSFNKEEDPTRSLCSVCNHGFFRYTSENNAAVSPLESDLLKDADGNSLTILSNGYVEAEGKCVMEFNAPLVTIGLNAFFDRSGFTGSLTIPNSVTSIGKGAFSNCSGFTGSLTIPNSVTSIGGYAFDYCKGFTGSLTIPNSVTSIGGYAFDFCVGFTGPLTIPNSVTSIGNYAFYQCDGFSSVVLQSIPQVGEGAFEEVTDSKSLNLSDASYVYTGSNEKFPELSSVTYTRTGIKNQWGTIVLPFDVAASGTGYQLYEVAYINEGNIGLNKLQGTVQAGTPALIQFASGITEITLTGSNSNLDVTGSLQDAGHDGYTLTGTYAKTNLTNTNGYAIANNAFWNIQEIKGSNQVWSAPFRAYFEADNAEASVLRILAGETSLDEVINNEQLTINKNCFNLQGQRIAAPRQGLNIVNGVKVMIK